MKIKSVSDLHLEFSDVMIPNYDCDVLILAGDIMIAQDLHDHPEPVSEADRRAIANGLGQGYRQRNAQRYRDFLKRVSFEFPHVIYVAGNHEFYNGKFYAGIDYLRAECSRYPNVYFLERDTKIIDDVVFVGGTLWTDMNRGDPLTLHAVRDMMNDFQVIRNDEKGYTALKPADVAIRHRDTLGYFKTVLDQNKDRKCVVVGHHGPSFQSVHERYRDQYIMNGAYQSELSEFILDRPQIQLWIHGHTHHPFDYQIGNTRVVCNPRGYHTESQHEDTGWDPGLILEI